MVEFTLKERLACSLIVKMKYNEVDFIKCRHNDFIIFILTRILKVDLDELIKKCMKNAGWECTD